MDGHESKDTIKCVLVGDGVGKTCLLMRFKDKTFNSNFYVPTVGELDMTLNKVPYRVQELDSLSHNDASWCHRTGVPFDNMV